MQVKQTSAIQTTCWKTKQDVDIIGTGPALKTILERYWLLLQVMHQDDSVFYVGGGSNIAGACYDLLC